MNLSFTCSKTLQDLSPKKIMSKNLNQSIRNRSKDGFILSFTVKKTTFFESFENILTFIHSYIFDDNSVIKSLPCET